jgi:Tat protein translocase TatB subunit
LTLLFFDLGSGEIFLVVLAIILVFGPGKIPEMARGLGKFINEVKRASEDVKTEINREADRIDREKRLEAYQNSLKKEETQPVTEKVENPVTNQNENIQ